MDLELKKLESALRGLKKPSIDMNVKLRIKKDVLMKMTQKKQAILPASLLNLANVIKRLSNNIEPSLVLKTKLKERILSITERTPFKWSFNLQKTVASFLVFLIAFSAIGIYSADIPVAKAARTTSFQEVIGDVLLIRDGIMQQAEENMEVKQGDTVITNENALAKIRYIDDSVTRLSPETEVMIYKLFQDQEDKSKTEVSIKLINGRIWSQVINLVDADSLFQILTDELNASSNNKASFDIEAQKNADNVKVSVFGNKITVNLPKVAQDESKYLLEGYSLEVSSNQPNVKKVTLSDEVQDDELWVQMNKAEDKKYIAEIEQAAADENKEVAGILPEDPLYSVKKINEGTKLLVTTDEIEKAKLKMDIAIKRLNEASVLLSEGKDETAANTIAEFNMIIEELMQIVANSEELQLFAAGLINEEAKNLSVILPDSPLYPVKEALREAKVAFAVSDEHKQEIATGNASEILIEAKELIAEDKGEIAVDTLSSDEVINEVVEVESGSKRELQQLVHDAEEILDETGTGEELTEVKTEIIFNEEVDPDAESDTAVIMSVLPEEQE